MRKSLELALPPHPLSGMARYSPALRPATMEENPSTGCDGRGIRMPLITPCGVTKLPEDGPGARVSAGRTARPASVGVELVSASAACAAAAGSAAAMRTAASSVLRFMRVFPSERLTGDWAPEQSTGGPGPTPPAGGVLRNERTGYGPAGAWRTRLRPFPLQLFRFREAPRRRALNRGFP